MSKRVDSDGRAYKGSQRQIQIYVNSRQRELNQHILRALPDLAATASHLHWVSPLQQQKYAEYRDKEFLKAIEHEHLYPELKKFWPRRGPVWDTLAVAENQNAPNIKGIVLVEAKSYPREMDSSGSRAVSNSSRRSIADAIRRTKRWLTIPDSFDWMGRSYQFANRLAHLYFLRELAHVPAWLVNIYFLNDPSSPTTREEWKQALDEFKAEMGLPSHIRYTADLYLDAVSRPVDENLLEERRDDILRTAEKYGARNVRIFGSVARGEARADSDIDMLVEFEPGRSLLDRIALMRELEELLGRKIDVVNEKALHWYIRDTVLQQAIPL